MRQRVSHSTMDPDDGWPDFGFLTHYLPLLIAVGSYVMNTIYTVLEDRRSTRWGNPVVQGDT